MFYIFSINSSSNQNGSLSVPPMFSITIHPIDFTLAECIAEDRKEVQCGVCAPEFYGTFLLVLCYVHTVYGI